MSASANLPGPQPATEKAAPISIAGEGRSKPGPKSGPKPKKPVDDKPRFFLAKSVDEQHIELGEELDSERDAIVKAFRSSHNFYVVTAYSADIEDQGNATVLVKRAVRR